MRATLNVLDLFSGLGGFSLGLERAGMRTVAFCELEPYCRAVLAKHWPDVPCFHDVRGLTATRLGRIDLICGGFPCQDISLAGRGAGLAGERSGLWGEFFRLIGECKPAWAIIENVSALRSRGLEAILGQLSSIGYDAEWHCIPAAAVGAPHRRDRVWIIAYPQGLHRRCVGTEARDGDESQGAPGASANATQVLGPAFFGEQSHGAIQRHWPQSWPEYFETIRGMDDGVSDRMDGLAALGNTLVPVIPEIIGRAIMAHATNS